jgi:hypothetical protein
VRAVVTKAFVEIPREMSKYRLSKQPPISLVLLSVVISTPNADNCWDDMTRGGMARSYGPAKGRARGAGRDAVTWARGGDRLEIPRQSSWATYPLTLPPPSLRERDDDVTADVDA